MPALKVERLAVLTFFRITLIYFYQGRMHCYGRGFTSLLEAKEEAAIQRRFLNELGHTIQPSAIEECCGRCAGTGKVLLPFTIDILDTCPDCKGEHSCLLAEVVL